jgi:hypothetical protein
MCDAHGVGQDRRIDVGIGLGIDPTDELNEFARRRLGMGASPVNGFTDQEDCHRLARISDARKSQNRGKCQGQSRISDARKSDPSPIWRIQATNFAR